MITERIGEIERDLNLIDLPNEINLQIFSYHPSELKPMAVVSQAIYRLIDQVRINLLNSEVRQASQIFSIGRNVKYFFMRNNNGMELKKLRMCTRNHYIVEILSLCPNITHLSLTDLYGCATAQSILPHNKDFIKLISIDLSYNDFQPEVAKIIAETESFKNITLLNLSGNKMSNGVQFLGLSKNLENLTNLDLTRNEIHGSSLQPWENLFYLTKLRVLKLSDNSLGKKGAFSLSKCPLSNLEKLYIDTNFSYANGALAGMKAICESEHYKNLSVLYADANNLNCSGIQQITNLTNLTILSVRHNRIGPDGAYALAQLKNLTSLDVSFNMFTAAGVQHLASMTSLCTLVLNGSAQIGDRGAQFLATSRSLTNLRRLHLAYSGIEAEGAHLIASSDLLGRLSFLDITPNFENSQILSKSEMLKNCQIYCSSYGQAKVLL
jgi:Ran GTPase-activating protein (RanGAP) involved in mRNA processing and transport